jgi:hypothetical protein
MRYGRLANTAMDPTPFSGVHAPFNDSLGSQKTLASARAIAWPFSRPQAANGVLTG